MDKRQAEGRIWSLRDDAQALRDHLRMAAKEGPQLLHPLTGIHDTKVPALVAQGKLDQADADNVLLPEINEAITCVEDLQAQAPTAA